MFKLSARDFIFSAFYLSTYHWMCKLNYRRKKAPTNVEAFLHHSLLLEIIMVPEAGLEPARLMFNQSAKDFIFSAFYLSTYHWMCKLNYRLSIARDYNGTRGRTCACTPDVQPEREGFYLLCLYLLTFEYISQIADVKKPQLLLRLFYTILKYVISYYK